MAGLINWKKVAPPASNPDADHLYVGVDPSDCKLYIKDDTGTIFKYETEANVAAAIALALDDYDLSTVVDSKISTAINNLVNGAGSALDTLNELAAALGNDPNFATTINTALANRLRVDTAAQGLNGTQKTNAKTNIDLQNVDNTSDVNKPVSTAQATAIANSISTHLAAPDPHPQYETSAEAQAKVDAHATLTNNPHSTTKAQVGLGNVDNTSDANKPVSTATQTALNLKYDASNPNGYETPAQLNTRDTNNRARANHTGTQLASTISDFATTVRNTVLSGLSIVDSAVVAADSVLVGIGKLQGQLNQALINVSAALALKADKILTGLVLQDAEILATDEVLTALGKLQGQINVWTELEQLNAVNNTSATTLASLGDLTFDVVNGRSYYFELNILFRSAAAGTGIAFTLANGGASGTISAQVNIPIAADGTAGMYQGWITSFGDIVTGTAVPAANTDLVMKVTGCFNCTTTGTITPQFRSETGGTQVTVQAGSFLLAREFA